MKLIHLESLPTRTTKGDLLRFLCEQGGIERGKVGKIDLRGTLATIEIPDDCAARLVKALDGASLGQRRVRVTAPTGVTSTSEGNHFQRLARLLELESSAEAQQTLERLRTISSAEAERTGVCLRDLVIVEESAGLGGRRILTLTKRNRTLDLPWSRHQVGAPVLLSSQRSAAESGRRGVVCERSRQVLRVAFSETADETDDSDDATVVYRLDLSSDEISRRRQASALERAGSAEKDRLAELRGILLGEAAPTFAAKGEFAPLDLMLDASQREAVAFALSAQDLAIIHGPPGTGKTTALVELIRQAVRRGEKVIACAPSNLAVDNLLERLLNHGERAVRLGHPARVTEALREHTLDLLVEDHEDVRQSRKYAKQAYALFRQAKKFTRAKPEPGARRDLRQEARALLTDARRLEDQAVERILDSATILCSTTTGLDGEILGQRGFDLAVIDEACQSTEPPCWLPILRCQRLVLAGDHCQLPPTIISRDAAEQGFGVSLLERLVALHGSEATRRLDVQYRMHEAIMAFSSEEFYEGTLEAAASVRAHLLRDLPEVRSEELTDTPIQFIDTAGAGYDDEQESEGDSRFNPEEARLVERRVRSLLDAGLRAADIAVITPYAAQVRYLRRLLDVPGLEIDSVDGFQGREKEAVVVSLVRSNRECEIGFLADIRRMNVAMTRARRKLLVIGDSATLSVHPFYQRLFTYFEKIGAYRTVWEEAEG